VETAKLRAEIKYEVKQLQKLKKELKERDEKAVTHPKPSDPSGL